MFLFHRRFSSTADMSSAPRFFEYKKSAVLGLAFELLFLEGEEATQKLRQIVSAFSKKPQQLLISAPLGAIYFMKFFN